MKIANFFVLAVREKPRPLLYTKPYPRRSPIPFKPLT